MNSRTEPGTHDRFKMRPLFDSIVAQDHIRSEFFSKLLKHKFGEFYGGELLNKLGCNCNFVPNSTWIADIFRQSSKNHFHPLLHALVQVFLEDKCAGQKSSAYEIRYEPRQWKCPNRYAPHDAHFRIPAVEQRRSNGRIYFSARCSCGYGFAFRNGSTLDPLLPEITRAFAWGPYFEREAKRLKDEGTLPSQNRFQNERLLRRSGAAPSTKEEFIRVHRQRSAFLAEKMAKTQIEYLILAVIPQ